MIEPKKCEAIINEDTQEVCGKMCLPMAVSSNLPASEWYCRDCHKSYRMDEATAREILTAEMRKRG